MIVYEAKDIMTKSVVYVKPDTSLYKAMEMLVKHNISGIPVVEDDMTLTAIISEKDILASYADFEHLIDKRVSDFFGLLSTGLLHYWSTTISDESRLRREAGSLALSADATSSKKC